MQPFLGQVKAIDLLLEKYTTGIKIVDFKAPTGSGKTFIATHLISEIILSKKVNEKIIFVIATLSSSELPKQFERKINNYKKYLKSNFEVKYVESPSKSNIKLKDFEPSIPVSNNLVLIFGKSSFGKGRVLTERGCFDIFIDQIKNEGYKLIYIRDEAHIGLKENKNNEVKAEKIVKNDNEEKMLHDNASFVVRMTATPKKPTNNKSYSQVLMKESDFSNGTDSLLKTASKFNFGISKIKQDGNNLISSLDLLKHALNEFKKIKSDYQSLNIGINPCILLQISSLGPNMDEKKLDEKVNEYKTIIKNNGLEWVVYFGDKTKNGSSTLEEINLNKISSNTSSIDVVIFKVGPATGWDIPRACMLIQLREVFSEQLNIQTIGRIKRNPYPRLKINKITDRYYVFSNYQEPSRDMYAYVLVEKFSNNNFPTVKLEKSCEESKNLNEYKEIHLPKWIKENEIDIKKKIIDTFDNKNQISVIKRKYISNEKQHNLIKINKSIILNEEIIHNGIELKIWLENQKNTIDIKKPWNFSKEKFIELYKNKISPEYTLANFEYVLLSDFKDKWLKNYFETYSDKNNYEYSLAKEKKLKPEYIIWANKGSSEDEGLLIDFEEVKENYAYRNTTIDKKYVQALDSKPEEIFMKKLISYIENNNDSKNISIWAKNPTFGNYIFNEYKNLYGDISKSYIDFVLKYKSINIYLEIKGHKDYDPEKSSQILSEMECYTSKISDPKINNMFFAIIQVNTDEKMREKMDFYYKFRTINDRIESIKEMFDLIDRYSN